MNLISDLINDILDPQISPSTILRKAKVLASNLKNKKFKKWVDNELNGYESTIDEVPDYRKGQTISYGNFVHPLGHTLNSVPIPTLNLPDSYKEVINRLLIAEGVGNLESLLETDSESFSSPWPADVIALISNKIFEDYTCISAWKRISRGQIAQVLNSVRNSLLNFILELQEKHPEIKDSEETLSKIPEDQVTSVVNNFIYGNHNVIGSGIGVTQEIYQRVQKNELESLLNYMGSIGVSQNDRKELSEAIKKDGSKIKPKEFGPKVTTWVSNMVKNILKGTWNVAISSGPTLISRALASYYGWE